MKYLILLILILIHLPVKAEWKMEISSNEQGSMGSDVFALKSEAIARLIKIAKNKRGWRKGTWDEVELSSLYSESRDITIYEDQGETVTYIDENDISHTDPVMTEVTTPTTFYYHPLNWSYSTTLWTVEAKAERDAVKAETANRDQARVILNRMNKGDALTNIQKDRVLKFLLRKHLGD